MPIVDQSNASAKAMVKIIPWVSCDKCRKIEHSEPIWLEINTILGCFQSSVEKKLAEKFIQPPIGWASFGRDKYICRNCKKS